MTTTDVFGGYGVTGGLASACRKPVITVWAEHSGGIKADSYQWSFGGGASGYRHRDSGFVMMVSGRITHMSIVTAHSGEKPKNFTTVLITVNGSPSYSHYLAKLPSDLSAIKKFSSPLELAAGNVINFLSESSNPLAVSSVVALLIELDL